MSDVVSEEVGTPRKSRLAHIPLSLIVESEVALRGVDRKNEEYLQLAQSVLRNGVLEPVLVREIVDPSGIVRYGLINGLQRYTAAKDAGLVDIPAHITDIADADLMEKQIITNLLRVQTKPAQYSTQLRRMISQNPLLTETELAEKLTCTVSWLRDRLSLTKLDKRIQEKVDNNEIGLANAYVLAKLPLDEQVEYVARAMTDPSDEFTSTVAQRLKEIAEAKKQGREPRSQEFVPIERVQSLGDLKSERSNASNRDRVLKTMNATTAEEGWAAALAWVLRVDPDSLETQRSNYEQKMAEREAAKAKAQAERAAQEAERAAKAQADLTRL